MNCKIGLLDLVLFKYLIPLQDECSTIDFFLKPTCHHKFPNTPFEGCNLNLNKIYHLQFQLHQGYGWSTCLHTQNPCNYSDIHFFCQDPWCVTFLDMVIPLKWSKNHNSEMFQCLLTFFVDVTIFSTTSMASFNYSFIHLPLEYVVSPLLAIVYFILCMVQVEMGVFLVQCWFIQHVVPSLAKDIEHYYNLVPPNPNLRGVGGKQLVFIKDILFLSFLKLDHEYKK